MRPWSPLRDERIAAAISRGDTDNIFFDEFVLDPNYPLPDWVRVGKLVAYRDDAGAVAKIADITPDPQHIYEMVIEWVPENERGLEGRTFYKWLTDTGEPEFERIFMSAPG